MEINCTGFDPVFTAGNWVTSGKVLGLWTVAFSFYNGDNSYFFLGPWNEMKWHVFNHQLHTWHAAELETQKPSAMNSVEEADCNYTSDFLSCLASPPLSVTLSDPTSCYFIKYAPAPGQITAKHVTTSRLDHTFSRRTFPPFITFIVPSNKWKLAL